MEMTKQDVVNNGWMTDVAIACDDKVTLDSELFKAHITHPDVYATLYGDSVEDPDAGDENKDQNSEDPNGDDNVNNPGDDNGTGEDLNDEGGEDTNTGDDEDLNGGDPETTTVDPVDGDEEPIVDPEA